MYGRKNSLGELQKTPADRSKAIELNLCLHSVSHKDSALLWPVGFEQAHQQYLAKNPARCYGSGGTEVLCPIAEWL